MKSVFKPSLTAIAAALILAGCQSDKAVSNKADSAVKQAEKAPDFWPEVRYETANQKEVEARINALLSNMTLEQKVAQIMQPEIRDVTVEDMRRYGFGSYLNGGGSFPGGNKHATMQEWVALAEAMYQASVDDSLDGSTIPTMWGTDAVHGHNNVIGATLFPHNIGLGAMRDAELVGKIAEATAKEVRATGIDWIFAPTVAVARDDRWGRTYEAYSEDPEVVGEYARAVVIGMQGDISDGNIDDEHVVSTVKHFIGDGGTYLGDDQGDNRADEKTLFDIHAQGYVQGLNAGAQSVMASFNSWHGEKIHGSQYLLTEVLKNRMGFDGFVVGDWNGHGQIEGCTNENCPQALNAGLDVYMVPTGAWKPLLENTIAQVKSGVIPLSRLDDAVRRVLRVKVRTGLFEQPSPANRKLSADAQIIGAQAHRNIAREAVRKSLVMLKNSNNLLPLSPAANILVAGDAADNIGKQSGGWSITWQGTGNKNQDFPGATSIFSGIEQTVEAAGGSATLSVDGSFDTRPDVAIVVFGEEPYAEGNGDLSNLEYQRGDKQDLALLKSLKERGVPTVAVFITGRPLWTNPEINASDAFVVAWLPGTEGQGIADVLFTNAQGVADYPMQGKLSFSWPATPTQVVNKGDGQKPQFAYGYGLQYGQPDPLSQPLAESAGAADDLVLTHNIFVRDFQNGWNLMVSSQGNDMAMTSNTLDSDAASVRTADRNVQEDSLAIDLKQAASVRFTAQFPEDLRDYNTDQAALVMDIQLDDPDHVPDIGLACSQQCSNYLRLSDYAESTSEWQTVRIPSRCFAERGASFKDVFTVLALHSEQPVQFRISDIRIEPDAQTNTPCAD